MKVRIFSHRSDPDGIGSVILAKLQYSIVDVTLVKDSFELDIKLQEYIKEKQYLNYDKIFITDLCPCIEILETIDCEQELKSRCLIFDHHQSTLDRIEKEYSFLTLFISKNEKQCCATSLFYDYLKNLAPCEKVQGRCVEHFVELTREIDVYDFKTENKKDAYSLQILYQFLGPWGYFYHFFQKCNERDSFSYSMTEKEWIEIQQKKNETEIEKLYNNLVLKENDGINYAICIANYEYRNVLADYIKENNKEIDAMLLIAGDESRFSFRSIKSNIDVNEVAETCGGGGHTQAAGGELNKETLQRILKFLN